MEAHMSKRKTICCIMVPLLLTPWSHPTAHSSEEERDLGVSKPKNTVKVILPSDVKKADLKKMKKATVLMSSTMPLFGQVAEDQLAIKLRDAGYDMTARTKLSDMTQKELLKEDVARLQAELKAYKEQLDLEKQLEKEPEGMKDLRRIEKRMDQILAQLEKVGATPQKESASIIEVARNLGLDALLLGTIFEGKRQIGFPDNKPPVSMEKIVVSTFHLQVVDVKTEKIMLSIMLEYDEGQNLTNTIDTMAKMLNDEMS
jgi:hypothetical protein